MLMWMARRGPRGPFRDSVLPEKFEKVSGLAMFNRQRESDYVCVAPGGKSNMGDLLFGGYEGN